MEWVPEGEVKGILQIAHGMVEFIGRYDRFGTWLAEKGFYVVGNDHLGHGASVISQEQHGYFAEPDGNACVIADLQKLREMTEEKYPGVPYFFMGHSMGSFLAAQYIEMYGKGLAGAIIMGTGYQAPGMLKTALALCKMIGRFKGQTHRSMMLYNMALGSNNKKFEPARTGADWLTKNEEIVDAYVANPWNQFKFTVNGYEMLFRTIQYAEDPAHINAIPKDLPVIFVSGADDPVGNFGAGPKTVSENFRKAGIKDVILKLYQGDRHEILNELDYETVHEDLYNWMTGHVSV